MSKRALKRILVTLVVLVGLWGLSSLASSRRGASPPATGGGVAAALEGLEGANVESVRLDGPLATLTLERSGGAWTVNGYPADSVALDRLWNALENAEVGGLVATNPANHGRMGVSSDSAWAVEVTRTGGAVSTVLVGNSGPTFPSAYARLPGHDSVVVVGGDLRSAVARGLVAWRDKTVLRTDTAALARIVIEADDGTHALERPDSLWTVNGEEADALAVGNLVRELNRLVATGFAEDLDDEAEADPRRVTAFDAAGDTLATVEIAGTGSTLQARVPGDDVVYEVPEWRVNRIVPTLETLLPPGDEGN